MKLLVACERVDAEGGTETYLRSLLPALVSRGYDVRVVARMVTQPEAYGVPAQAVEWSDEHDAPCAEAANAVAAIAREFRPDVAALHNILDVGILDIIRRSRRASFIIFTITARFAPTATGFIHKAATSARWRWASSTADGTRSSTGAPTGRGAHASVDQKSGSRSARGWDERCDDRVFAVSREPGTTQRYQCGTTARRCARARRCGFCAISGCASQTDAVLFAGRVMPSKGARSLVRAVASIPPLQRPLLRIAGVGPDLAATLDDARSRGVRSEALGRLDAAGLRRAYDDATLVAMPSLWGEPFGLAGIEAFARGRPVVAYDVGAISEWLRNGLGRLVPRGDERALGAAILGLLERDTWTESSALAFAASHSYRIAAHVERIGEIYRR